MAATYTKPVKVPRWADISGNVIEPPEAKKDEGWLFEEIPPSSWVNWRTRLIGEWFKWLGERFFDGASKDELLIKSPGGAVDALLVTDILMESKIPFQSLGSGLTPGGNFVGGSHAMGGPGIHAEGGVPLSDGDGGLGGKIAGSDAVTTGDGGVGLQILGGHGAGNGDGGRGATLVPGVGAGTGSIGAAANFSPQTRPTGGEFNGDFIYNSAQNRFEVYQNGEWRYIDTTSVAV